MALSPGAEAFIDAFFSLSGFNDSFSSVVAGFWLNVKLMLIAEAIVLVFALVIAVVRSLPGPVHGAAAARGADLHRRVPRRSR